METEQEAQRQERISKRAQINISMSRFPPRMEKWEKERVIYPYLTFFLIINLLS